MSGHILAVVQLQKRHRKGSTVSIRHMIEQHQKERTVWSDHNVSSIEIKKQVYLKYLNTKTNAVKVEYKRRCDIIKKETK
jgi:nitric oxide reductase activation protein